MALVHLTGPCRGRVTWLRGATLDIALDGQGFPHVSAARPGEAAEDAVAHLQRDDETYQIAAPGERSLWVNRVPVKAQNFTAVT